MLIIKQPWILVAAFTLVANLARPAEELTFRGEVVVVDLEASSVVVKTRKEGTWTERLFEVAVTTEITSRVSAEDGEERGEPEPITLVDLAEGDAVVVQYQVIKGRNVATLIVRTGAEHA